MMRVLFPAGTASPSGISHRGLRRFYESWPKILTYRRQTQLSMLLAIDTSSRYGGVALANGDGGIVDAHLWRSQFNHTAKLMPAVAATLQSHGLHVADLTGVAVALGPGPFSALRVGVSAAKGLAMAATLPIVGVDSLALEAAPHLVSGCITLAWLDAGRGEVAAGWFGGDGQRTKVDEIAPPADLLEAAAGDQSPRIYCGEAAFGHRDFILASVVEQDGEIPTVHVAPWTPRRPIVGAGRCL